MGHVSIAHIQYPCLLHNTALFLGMFACSATVGLLFQTCISVSQITFLLSFSFSFSFSLSHTHTHTHTHTHISPNPPHSIPLAPAILTGWLVCRPVLVHHCVHVTCSVAVSPLCGSSSESMYCPRSSALSPTYKQQFLGSNSIARASSCSLRSTTDWWSGVPHPSAHQAPGCGLPVGQLPMDGWMDGRADGPHSYIPDRRKCEGEM